MDAPNKLPGLKPCPFCGEEDAIELVANDDASRTFRAEHIEVDCVLSSASMGDYTSPEHFAEWWNARVDDVAANESWSAVETPRPNGGFWYEIVAEGRNPNVDPAQDAIAEVFGDGAKENAALIVLAVNATRPQPAVLDEQREGKIVAVSDDAIRHLEIRSPLNRAIYAAVRGYRMGNMCDEDDASVAYPLVDLMSNPTPADIGTGEMEMVALVDEIEAAVRAHIAITTAAAVQAERKVSAEDAREIAWLEAWLARDGLGYTVSADDMRTAIRAAIRTRDASEGGAGCTSTQNDGGAA